MAEAKFAKANPNEVAEDMDCSSPSERDALLKVLKNHKELFDGTLGTWKREALEVKLQQGITPHHAKPHPIPKACEQTLEDEVDHSCESGVLHKVNRND